MKPAGTTRLLIENQSQEVIDVLVEPEVAGRVRQCPRCELRFLDEWELQDHLRADHHVDGLQHVYWKDRQSPLSH